MIHRGMIDRAALATEDQGTSTPPTTGSCRMAGPTDILTEDVKDLREANRLLTSEIKGAFERLSADLRDSSQGLAGAIREVARDLSSFRVEVAKELGDLRTQVAKELGTINADLGHSRVEVAKELGTIQTSLEKYQGRTEAYLAVARWAVGVATVVVLGLVAWSYSAYARAVRIEQSVVELKQSVVELKQSVVELKQSVVELRDHAKQQDGRIDKLIELQRTTGRATASKSPAISASPPIERR
jgi:hypothetical protein